MFWKYVANLQENTHAKVRFQKNFIEIALRHGCSPVNLMHIFKTPFEGTPLGGCFWKLLFIPQVNATHYGIKSLRYNGPVIWNEFFRNTGNNNNLCNTGISKIKHYLKDQANNESGSKVEEVPLLNLEIFEDLHRTLKGNYEYMAFKLPFFPFFFLTVHFFRSQIAPFA